MSSPGGSSKTTPNDAELPFPMPNNPEPCLATKGQAYMADRWLTALAIQLYLDCPYAASTPSMPMEGDMSTAASFTPTGSCLLIASHGLPTGRLLAPNCRPTTDD